VLGELTTLPQTFWLDLRGLLVKEGSRGGKGKEGRMGNGRVTRGEGREKE